MTDDWDRRCIMNILNDFYSPAVLSDEHKFSESGIYHQLPLTADHEVMYLLDLGPGTPSFLPWGWGGRNGRRLH